MPVPSLMKGVPLILQEEATATGNGIAAAVPITNDNLIVIIEGSGTISAGVISIEESDDPEYAGDWSVIQTVNAVDVTSDAQKIIHIAGQIRAIRTRITTTVSGGGDITTKVVCN